MYKKMAMMAPLTAVLLACTTVTLKGDKEEPIEVNLNVNVSGEVRVKLEREIDDAIAENPDIF